MFKIQTHGKEVFGIGPHVEEDKELNSKEQSSVEEDVNDTSE
jgi:hypothetical protein